MNEQTAQPVENILIIKHGALGDFILATGAMQAIREHHPSAHITLLTTPPYKKLGDACPFVNEVWVDIRPKFWQLNEIINLFLRLRSKPFYRVYDLQTSDRSNFYYHIISKKSEWCGIAPGCDFEHIDPYRTDMHTLDRLKDQLSLCGIEKVPPPNVGWLKADFTKYVTLLHENEEKQRELHASEETQESETETQEDEADSRPYPPYFLLVAGGSAHRPEKRWPAENFIELCEAMEVHKITPVLIGSVAEQAIMYEIAEACPGSINLCGRTQYEDIAELARNAEFAVGNDTGPMHIIAATGCETVLLFSGYSNPKKVAPRGRHVHVLQKQELMQLSPILVTNRIEEYMADLKREEEETEEEVEKEDVLSTV